MKALLEEVQSIPGVIGSYVFNPEKGIIISEMPLVFKDSNLVKIGKMLAKIYMTGFGSFPDISEITLYYDESLVVVRKIPAGVFLIIFCDPSLNLNLLTMTLNLIMDDLNKKGQNDIYNANNGSVALSDKKPSPKNPKDIINNGPLADTLKSMEKALAKVMGPMAKIIFKDSVDEWALNNMPSFDSIDSLVNLLAKEIDDPEKIDYYRELIEPYLNL